MKIYNAGSKPAIVRIYKYTDKYSQYVYNQSMEVDYDQKTDPTWE